MIHNDIQNQLALLVKTSAPPLIEVADSPVESPQWVPGQRLPAHVIASMPNGRFQVQIENQMLDMNLPRNTQPGDTLELTYLAPAPRMTFALAPALEQALPQPPNTGVTLSDTARFLGALLQRSAAQPGQPENPAQPGAASNSGQNRIATAELNKTSVVVPGVPPPVKEFAQALRSAVSQSGLFYESHQAQWVSGERTLSSLQQEPQSHLPVLNARLPTSAQQGAQPGLQNPAGTALPGAAQNMPHAAASSQTGGAVPTAVAQQAGATGAGVSPAHGQPQVRPGEQTMPAGSERDFGLRAAGAASAQAAAIAQDPVHPLAQPLVQQQLDTLENHQIVWQGQVWPGQQMHWEIDEDGAHASDEESDQAPRWRTRLHLELPGLGGVTANILLDGQGVHVGFVADRDATVTRMRDDFTALASSMEAAGLRVAELQINPDVTAV